MIEQKDCPVCGGAIVIVYVRPDLTYYIENGKIVRDTNNDLWDGTEPFLRFQCSNDALHDMEAKTIFDDPKDTSLRDWMEMVQKEFYEGAHYDTG